MYEIDCIYDSRIKRRRRIDPTRELNYMPAHWERHKSVWRRWKHVGTTLGSSPFQRLLFPDLLLTSVVAGGLTYYNEVVASSPAAQVFMDMGGFAAGTTGIAILTGFRLNGSYGRYNDARQLMGVVNTTSRDLASNALMWILCPRDRERMLRLIKAYSVALNFHVNVKGAHHGMRRCDPQFEERVYAEYEAEMRDVFFGDPRRHGAAHGHGSDDDNGPNINKDFARVCTWFRQGHSVPLGITALMRRIIVDNADQKDALNRELDVQVQGLTYALGA